MKEESSDEEESYDNIRYSSLKVPSSRRQRERGNSLQRREMEQESWDRKHLEKCNELQEIEYERLEMQNETLKNNQVLLTQILLSNQKKLRNL